MGDFEIELEDSMRESFREIEDSVDEIEEVESEEVSDGRLRDEKGRFLPKEEPEEVVSDEIPEEEPDVVEEEGPEGIIVAEEQQIAPVESVVNPPSTWTPEAKTMWSEVPERVKQEILKREEDAIRGVESLKAELQEGAQFGQSMKAVVDPYMPIIQAEGGTAEGAVGEMLNSAYILRQGHPAQKAQMALQLAQQYGFGNELVAMLNGTMQNTPVPQYDPAVEELRHELAELKRQQEQAVTGSAEQQIADFASAQNEDGSLTYPFFENLREDMYVLLQAGKSETLEDAYNAALWMNPETRALQQREQTSQAEMARQEQARERAKKAEKANKVNLPKRGHHESKSPKPTGSIEDTMREAMERLNAG